MLRCKDDRPIITERTLEKVSARVVVTKRTDVGDSCLLPLTAVRSSIPRRGAPSNELVNEGRDEIVAPALEPTRVAFRLFVHKQGVHVMVCEASRIIELSI
jgi:hypothetical protein